MRISRRRDESGAALVESAIAVPVVFLLLMAVIGSMFLIRSYISVRDSAAAGARAASIDSTSPFADYDALQGIKRGSSSLSSSSGVVIVVFRSPTEDGSMNSECVNHSIAGVCNRYTRADFLRPESDFTGTGSAPDAAWAPSSRKANDVEDDYVGVYVQADVASVDLPFPHQLSQTALVQLQTA